MSDRIDGVKRLVERQIMNVHGRFLLLNNFAGFQVEQLDESVVITAGRQQP